MPTKTKPEPFHPDLRFARWIPPIAAGPRTLRVFRASPKGKSSTAEVTITTASIGGRECRVFRPAAATDTTPALFWIHGGGLIFGAPQQDDATNLRIARDLGITVIAASYRLAPEHPGPAALDDLASAYRDMTARAGEFAIDSTRIAIGGASAGGGLAAALVNRLHDEGGVQPVFQLLVYPMLDDRTVLRRDADTRRLRIWRTSSNRFGWASYLGAEPGGADISPALAPARREDLTGLPPAWIGVGSLDLFHDEDLAYAERLRASGVDCEVMVVDGAFHGFDAVFRSADVTRAFHDEWARVLRAALAP